MVWSESFLLSILDFFFSLLYLVVLGGIKRLFTFQFTCHWFSVKRELSRLLELEDVMAVDIPEPKSLITYVHFIYQHFAEKQQQQKEG